MKATGEEIISAFPSLTSLGDGDLLLKVVELWRSLLEESAWEELNACPFMPDVADVTLVQHTNQVVETSVAVWQKEQRYGSGQLRVDQDLLISAAVCHDVSKLVEFEPAERGARKSRLGEALQHGVYACHAALKLGVPLTVIEIISKHTPESQLVPRTPEGIIICHADMVISDLNRLRLGRTLHLEKMA